MGLSRFQARPAHQLWIGFAQAFGALALMAVVLAWAAAGPLGYASSETLRSMAGVGVALLLGYVLEEVWLVNRAERKDQHQHENWLGFVSGVGFGGLLGIAVALATSAHLEAGHRNLLDDLGLWWSVSSLGTLGILVTSQPFITDREKAA